MFNHIIKYDYRDGVKLTKHEIETWFGCSPEFSDWLFQDAQHALLVMEQGGRIIPCKSCQKYNQNGIESRCSCRRL